jgi:hypothetical protein
MGRLREQGRALRGRQPWRHTIGARDFGQDERRERLTESVGVGLSGFEHRAEPLEQLRARGDVEAIRAQPGGISLERDSIAQSRIRIGKARQQRQRERLAPRVVGHFETRGLQRFE